MSKSFVCLNPILTICVQNIDPGVEKEEIERFVSDFGKVRKIVYKSSKFDGSNYVLVEFDDEETAKNSVIEIDGRVLGKGKVVVRKYRPKNYEFEFKEQFYELVRNKAKEVVGFARNRIKELYPIEEKAVEKYSLPNSPNITRDIPAHQLIEFLSRRVSEQSPSLLNKFRRSCKKLQLDQLYLLHNQEAFFQSFLSSLS